MKAVYRGFELEAKREKCLGGWSQVYCTAYRTSDGWDMICYHTEAKDPIHTFIKDLKKQIDEYFENPSLYDDEVSE